MSFFYTGEIRSVVITFNDKRDTPVDHTSVAPYGLRNLSTTFTVQSNHDQQRTYPDWIEQLFAEIDRNKDGVISGDEFQRALKGKRKHQLRAVFSSHSTDWKPVAARLAHKECVDLLEFHRRVYKTKVVVVGDQVCHKVLLCSFI